MNNYYKKALAILLCIGHSLSMELQNQGGFDQPHPQKTIEVQYRTGKLTDDLIHELSQFADCKMLLTLVLPHNRYNEDVFKPIISGISTEKALELLRKDYIKLGIAESGIEVMPEFIGTFSSYPLRTMNVLRRNKLLDPSVLESLT